LADPLPESERRKLSAFLNSKDGQDWTLNTILEAAKVTKESWVECRNCGRKNKAEIMDANAAVNAVKFAHEWGILKPKDDGDNLPKVARLKDLKPAQRDKLRQILYTRLAGELDAVEV
jgi:hypothetical protein